MIISIEMKPNGNIILQNGSLRGQKETAAKERLTRITNEGVFTGSIMTDCRV